jgi:hypothetical protein
MQTTVSEVVWGITTLPNGAATTYDIDFGDGTAHATGTVTDRSYIAVNHTYALSNPNVTVTLTVTSGGSPETATTTVQVYDRSSLSPDVAREFDVNRAIQNGLRYLWTSQSNRTTFDTNIQTSWGGYSGAPTALAVQAFQNQGYRLPNSDAEPTGIYAKYAVRRGLNYILARLGSYAIGTTPAGNNACSSGGAAPFLLPAGTECDALYQHIYVYSGYENGLAMLAFAGTGALNRTNTEVTTANTTGQTLGQILQRLANASAYGQCDSGNGRGGWYYYLNNCGSDGSVAGWELVGLLDAESAGAVVPAWVKTEWAAGALPNAINTDGSFDYQADANPASDYYVNMAKTGVGLQGMFFAGIPGNDSRVTQSLSWMTTDWGSASLSGYNCSGGTDMFNANYGCAYGMFNAFKGLKLYGVPTLPGIGYVPPAGTSIQNDDWYADEVDWLLAHQTNPTATTGGYWGTMYFSGAWGGDAPTDAAVALLILSPTALVLPDPETFSTLGLQQGSPLSTDPATNPVTNPPGTHTVTGITLSSAGAPIPSVTITFQVTSGPNAGQTGTGVTGANGQATFTYTDNGGAGTDNIQASVGALKSNVLVKNWENPSLTCDVNDDGVVSTADLLLIRGRNNQTASGPNDPYDANHDGVINVADFVYCLARRTSSTP